MEKEAKFMLAVKTYIKENGYSHLFDAVPPTSKRKLLPATVDLPKVKTVDIEEFKKDVVNSVHKHKKLYERFKHIPNIEFLIHRYDVMGYLNNISLSVSPKLKKEWKINHELFGAFYNVDLNNTYCSLFPDLEPNSLGNVFFFKPKKDMIILANPPYTSDFIKWTCNKIIEWKGKATFYVILPVWDRKTRDELGLKRAPDLPEINNLIAISDHAEVLHHFPFYNGIENKEVKLRDPIHLITILR